jgi:hypothetical protein
VTQQHNLFVVSTDFRKKLSGGQEIRTDNDFLSKHALDLDLGPFKTVAQNRSLIFALQHFQTRESPKNYREMV